MSLNLLSKEIHENAKNAGWYDKYRSPLEHHMLIVSEIAEASEEVRNGTAPYYKSYDEAKPEGEAVEIADALIIILDYAAYKGWDLDKIIREKIEYNKTRPYRHGNKAY